VSSHELARKVAAELVGTAFLVCSVDGSGVMATRLTDDVGLQLLCNSLATGGALVALILTLQPVSAAFNPVVTAVEAALGGVSWRDAGIFSAAQVAGGIVGAIVANLMFDLDAVTWSTHDRTGTGQWIGEVVATLGLVLVVFGGIRSSRTETIAFAVAGYIVAGYWFTSSTSVANPAVALARMFTDTFSGVAPSSAPMFILMQVVGGVLGLLLVRFLWPHTAAVPSRAHEQVDA
jgi:glycerol uptake facilitator-like aquaporin